MTLKAMRVLILWADAESSNLGVRVLGRGAESLARSAWGNDVQVEFQSFAMGPLETQLSGKTVVRGLLTSNKSIRKYMCRYDAIIDTGAGDSFTDIYGFKRLAIMVYTRLVARQCKVPIILAPQTIGPFRTIWGRAAARLTLKSAHTVMARDSASAEFARRLGRPADCLATDVAFALTAPQSSSEKLADVALNVSGLLWNSNAHGSMDKYREITRELIDKLLHAGRSVTLLAHVVDNPSADNDMDAIAELQTEYGDRVDVYVPDSLDEVRGFISRCNVVVGARMHACLNALSLGVPAIPLAYSRKFAPLLDDIGWPHTLDLREDSDIPDKVLAMLGRDTLGGEAMNVRNLAEKKLESAVEHLAASIRAMA